MILIIIRAKTTVQLGLFVIRIIEKPTLKDLTHLYKFRLCRTIHNGVFRFSMQCRSLIDTVNISK